MRRPQSGSVLVASGIAFTVRVFAPIVMGVELIVRKVLSLWGVDLTNAGINLAWSAPAPAPPVVQEVAIETTPAAPRTLLVGERVVGGLVRTALLEHYQDSARRSFQAPTQSALEGELARFVSGVYRDQSELLKHAYELNRLASSPDVDRDALRARLNKVSAHERAIYNGLSETLPRRFWTVDGRAAVEALGDPATEAEALLKDALALEETLTSMFNRASDAFDIGSDVSSGRLLERIQARVKNLRAGLRTL